MVKIYDLECLCNFFSYAAVNVTDDTICCIYLSPTDDNWKEQLQSLYNELDTVKGLIGFNNINYDYPLLHYILVNRVKLLQLDINEIVDLLYKESQRIIDTEYSAIDEKNVIIPQLDLYRIWHYDNKNRRVGLKTLQISMNYPNVQDMPFKHTDSINSINDVHLIIEYNINDILSTKMFYEKSIDKINLRKKLIESYNIPCINWSDSKIGEQLMLKLYCDATGLNPYDVKKLRTHRSVLKFSDCIPEYITFKSKEFNDLLIYLKNITVDKLKDSFEYSVIYKGFKYDLGTGGIHGAAKSGIYKATGNDIIKDSDVASLYPSLAIVNNIYPEHLGKEFIKVYKEGIVDERLKAKKAGNMVISDALKLAANSVYGKSNSEYSFLCDPLYTLKTTLGGQLSLCMLAERLVDTIPNIEVIQINTDGITTKFDKQYDELYDLICETWQQDTKLILEHVYYSKMIMRDVNSYIAVKDDGKAKYKGAFEFDKFVGSEPAYHKDNSFRIIPLALSEYFVNSVPIEVTIKNHTNIYDFCGRYKGDKQWGSEIYYVERGEYIHKILQKTNRYYVSNRGVKYFKYNIEDGRKQEVQKSQYVTIFNNYVKKNITEYDIDYTYYIIECKKIINIIEKMELLLF